MPRKKEHAQVEIKDPKQLREEIRLKIRDDAGSFEKKQSILKESIKSEDHRRIEFIAWKLKQDTRTIPIKILKLIGSLKKAVRYTMRYKGGTPFSIIRELFIYWDSDKSGEISAVELNRCMKSLGVIISPEECEDIVMYYNKTNIPGGEMRYEELLKDLVVGEPSLIAYVSEKEEKEQNAKELRYEEIEEAYHVQPPLVKKFIEAVREWMQKLLRNVGGTPDQHIRWLFKFYDYDYSSGLYAKELVIASKRSLNLRVSFEEAEQIVKFYDRKNLGQMQFEPFVADVCEHIKPVLTFTELSQQEIADRKRSLAVNPFIPVPFAAPPNKIIEKFKHDCRIALRDKVNKFGGSYASWIRDAFVFWDPGYTKKIPGYESLLGVAKRIGVSITEQEAKVLLKYYDRFNTNEMHYDYFTEEIMNESPNFLMEAALLDPTITPTTRTPPMVETCLKKIKTAVEKFVTKSKGLLVGKDLLHGTFVRFDTLKSGRIDAAGFKAATSELKANTTDPELSATVKWFDTNGTLSLDYNSLTKQIYGDDITTDKLTLPRIKEGKRFNTLVETLNTSTYGSTIMPELRSASVRDLNRAASGTDGIGLKVSTLEKNLNIIESEAVKLARKKMNRMKILSDKVKIERKIQSLDDQRKRIIEDFKARKK